VIRAFTTELKHDISTLISSVAHFEYSNLLEESYNYVTDVVWHSLCRNANTENHLKIFEAADKLGRVNSISTLCHDAHVESFLRKSNISLSDRYSNELAGVRYWNGEFFLLAKSRSSNCTARSIGFDFARKEAKFGTMTWLESLSAVIVTMRSEKTANL